MSGRTDMSSGACPKSRNRPHGVHCLSYTTHGIMSESSLACLSLTCHCIFLASNTYMSSLAHSQLAAAQAEPSVARQLQPARHHILHTRKMRLNYCFRRPQPSLWAGWLSHWTPLY